MVTSYLLFCKQHRKKIVEENPGLGKNCSFMNMNVDSSYILELFLKLMCTVGVNLGQSPQPSIINYNVFVNLVVSRPLTVQHHYDKILTGQQ